MVHFLLRQVLFRDTLTSLVRLAWSYYPSWLVFSNTNSYSFVNSLVNSESSSSEISISSNFTTYFNHFYFLPLKNSISNVVFVKRLSKICLFESYGEISTRTFDFRTMFWSSTPPQQVNTYWGEILVFWAELRKSWKVWLILLKSKKLSLLIWGLWHWSVPQGPFITRTGCTLLCVHKP